MSRRPTYHETSYGKTPGIDELAKIWTEALTERLLETVWKAYDDVYIIWSKIDWSMRYEDMERSLTEDLVRAINSRMNDFSPITPMHGASERESRSKPPAQPPEYDIAFQWIGNPRLMWPLEAKVVRTDQNTQDNLKDYEETVKRRYLTCYYAPFSTGGAMIIYLVSGDPETVVKHVELRLDTTLTAHPAFPTRCHMMSEHTRMVPSGKSYPSAFRLQHMILPLENSRNKAKLAEI